MKTSNRQPQDNVNRMDTYAFHEEEKKEEAFMVHRQDEHDDFNGKMYLDSLIMTVPVDITISGIFSSKTNDSNISKRRNRNSVRILAKDESTQSKKAENPIYIVLTALAMLLIAIYSGAMIGTEISIPSFIGSSSPSTTILDLENDPTSIYVPGAGFSGFWFTLGRLQSIPNPHEQNYYCFSAGCLAIITTLSNQTVQEVAEMALGVQHQWRTGEISRYEVVTEFVDRLVPLEGVMSNNLELLERINVVTTTKGLGVNVRRPRSVAELREMLIQTTWIPFATGWGMWKMDQIGDFHMDGGASFFSHPKCTHSLNLPLMLDLFLNVLNPNLGMEKVQKFWNAGLEFGL